MYNALGYFRTIEKTSKLTSWEGPDFASMGSPKVFEKEVPNCGKHSIPTLLRFQEFFFGIDFGFLFEIT